MHLLLSKWEMDKKLKFGQMYGVLKYLSDKFRNLLTLTGKKGTFAADLHNNNRSANCWNLGFNRGFFELEVEAVNELYAIIAN